MLQSLIADRYDFQYSRLGVPIIHGARRANHLYEALGMALSM